LAGRLNHPVLPSKVLAYHTIVTNSQLHEQLNRFWQLTSRHQVLALPKKEFASSILLTTFREIRRAGSKTSYQGTSLS